MFLSPRSTLSRYVLPVLFLGVGLFFFLIPGVRLIFDLQDPALRSAGIPQAAWRLHHRLAAPYATWAQDRIDSARGVKVESTDVSGTEWPLFGSVFYLWSMESLQASWEADPRQAAVAPVVEARAAIENAANLVVDFHQAAWVREKWGPNYLHHQDLFYRFLLISAMTSYTHLTGNASLLGPLRDQVETLSAELDASRSGLLEDYPGECYPTDVVGAITAIRRADAVLKTDHSAFVQRALRAFQPPHLDPDGLPPYNANALMGVSQHDSRGCGNSFVVICAPEIWPVAAATWYQAYVAHFWQARNGLVGFREFSTRVPQAETFMDVDSGPVIWGFGFAASAFGTGAARVNGRMDQAGPLAVEMLVSSWPLANGTLLVPRALSNATDAPYLGETGILYCLTRQPVAGTVTPCPSVMTPFVWAMLAFYLGLGLLCAAPFVKEILWPALQRCLRGRNVK